MRENIIQKRKVALMISSLNVEHELDNYPSLYYGNSVMFNHFNVNIEACIGQHSVLQGKLLPGDKLEFVDIDELEKQAREESYKIGHDDGYAEGYKKAQEEFKKKAEEIFFGKDKK